MDARANACVASFLECAGCSIALDEFTFANAEDESVRIVHQGSNTQIFVTGYDKPVAQFLVGAFAHIDKYISRETFEEIREWTRESFLTAKKIATHLLKSEDILWNVNPEEDYARSLCNPVVAIRMPMHKILSSKDVLLIDTMCALPYFLDAIRPDHIVNSVFECRMDFSALHILFLQCASSRAIIKRLEGNKRLAFVILSKLYNDSDVFKQSFAGTWLEQYVQ